MMNGLLGLQAQKHCYGAGLWSSTIPAGRRAPSWTGLKLCFSFWKAYGDNWLKDLVTCSHHHHGMAVAPSKGTGESHAVRLAAHRAAKQDAPHLWGLCRDMRWLMPTTPRNLAGACGLQPHNCKIGTLALQAMG